MDSAPAGPGSHLGWRQGLIFFLVVLGLMLVSLHVLVSLLAGLGLLGSTEAEISASLMSPGSITAQVALTSLILGGFAFAVPALNGLVPASWLGLSPTRSVSLAVTCLGVLALGFVVDEIVYQSHSLAPDLFDSSGLASFNLAFQTAPGLSFVLLTAAVTLGPALGEELFFRGFLLRALRADLPSWLAIAASSVLFGVLHLDLLQGLGATLLGAYFGFVVLRLGTIWPAVVAHGLNNLLCALFARYDPGGIGQIWSAGHPLPLLVGAAAVFALCVGWLRKSTKL